MNAYSRREMEIAGICFLHVFLNALFSFPFLFFVLILFFLSPSPSRVTVTRCSFAEKNAKPDHPAEMPELCGDVQLCLRFSTPFRHGPRPSTTEGRTHRLRDSTDHPSWTTGPALARLQAFVHFAGSGHATAATAPTPRVWDAFANTSDALHPPEEQRLSRSSFL